jgi:hypothetical protein
MTGPGLGGILVAVLGPACVFGINAVSFLASGVSELFTRSPDRPGGGSSSGPFRDLADGFGHFLHDRTLRGIAVVFGVLNLLGTPLFLFPPLFASSRFGQGAAGIGLTITATALGGSIFSMILHIRGNFRHKGMMMLLGTMAAGILAVPLSMAGRFWLFLPLLVLIGFTLGININLLNMIVQTRVETSYIGRVYSFFLLILTTLVPLGYTVFTLLLNHFDLAVLTAASGISVAAAALCFLLVPGFLKI